MFQTRILNEKEVEEFNNKYNTNYTSIILKQENKKYYAVADCDIKIKMYSKEIINYFK